MKSLRYTLVADGPSDDALIPILDWLLRRCGVAMPIKASFANFRYVVRTPRSLVEKMEEAVRLYDCDLLFVHRDAEAQPPASRFSEIRRAEAAFKTDREPPPVVGVVPVRMTEALLLFDEHAIRRASGNPNGRAELNLPPLKRCEDVPDPKAILHAALRAASGLAGRRLKQYMVTDKSRRVAQLIENFEPLIELSAIRTLESDILALIRVRDWDTPRN